MTYFTGNTISTNSFMEFRGPLGPNQPYPDEATAATGPVAALIGWGYGKRGYGQTTQFLPAVNPRSRVSHIEWNALQETMGNINIHTGSGFELQPKVDIYGEIIAEDGVNSTANVEALVSGLDANRMLFDPEQMITNVAITSTRVEPWTGTITHEFTVDFGDEDHARWYFNSGGSIDVSADRQYGTVSNVTVIASPFRSPELYPASWSRWSEFMNTYGVWVDSNPNEKPDRGGQLQVYYRNFNAPYTGKYRISIQGDNIVTLYVDGVPTATNMEWYGSPLEVDVTLSTGNHVLRFECMNNAQDTSGDRDWDNNPAGWASTIKQVVWDTRSHLAAEVITTPTNFTSPQVYAVQPFNSWSAWLNSNSVWVNPGTAVLKNQTQNIYRNFTAPYSGTYNVEIAVDDRLKLYVDGNLVANVYRNYKDDSPFTTSINLSAGQHVLRFEALNDGTGDTWNTNPAGWGVVISGAVLWDTRTYKASENVTNTSFYSPQVYPVTSAAGDWNSFMNGNAVWVKPAAESVVGTTQTRHRLLEVTEAGNHTFTYAVDDTMTIFLNDAAVITSDVRTSRTGIAPGTKVLNLREGTYVLRVDAYNNPIRGGWAITVQNPSGGTIWKTRDHLAQEQIPGPQGPNVTVITDGTTNGLVSNLLTLSGTVVLSADDIESTGSIGNTHVSGYYGLTSDYQTVFAAYDVGQPPTSTMVKSNTYTTSSTAYSYKVPDNVNLLRFKLWGAGGAGGAKYNTSTPFAGGAGAYVQATIPVTAGETLTVRVGGGGQKGIISTWEDTYGGGGGGYTGVFRGSTPLLIAAGGGGSPAAGPNTDGTVAWTTRGHLAAETISIPNQAPFTSPQVYSVNWGSWSSFMNSNAVWTQASSSVPAPTTVTIYRNLTAAAAGTYTFTYAADNEVSVYVDEVFVGKSTSYTGTPSSTDITLGAGAHIIKVVATNQNNPSPAGWALTVTAPRVAGKGGAGGIAEGSPGTTGNGTISSTGGTQTAGGTGGTGTSSAWNGANGAYLQGGYGGNHDVSGGKWTINESYTKNGIIPGVNGGMNGGAMGGEQGAGGGGGGYFGGGGGGGANATETGTPYSSGGGAGGSSYVAPSAGNVVTAASTNWHSAPNKTDDDYVSGVAEGGSPATNKGGAGSDGGPGLAVLYTAGTVVPPQSINWIVQARREGYNGLRAANGSKLRIASMVTCNGTAPAVPTPHPVCISVINETSLSAATIQASYNQFRSQYPNYYLYLLQPQGSYGPSALKIPVGWSQANGDFGVITVTEDNGNPANKSDWYAACNLDQLPSGSKIGIFLDNSGSLGTNKVSASYDYLLQRIAARNITQVTAINATENWVSPFLTMNIAVPQIPATTTSKVDGLITSTVERRKAAGVLRIDEPAFNTTIGLDQGGVVTGPTTTLEATCVAVIDEVSPSAASIQATYNEFRRKWPNRTLYLMWPKSGSGTAVDVLKIPQGWSNSVGDFGPYTVNRDNGDTTKRSDWFSIIGMDALPVDAPVALFIDKSGSMTLNTVRASYDLFLQKCQAKKLRLVTTFNGGENWIAPFIPKLFV